MPVGWRLPDSFVDPSSDWADEEKGYDENVETFARGLTKKYNDWSTFIEFHLDSAIPCNKIKHYLDAYKRDLADIDLYYDGAWHDLYYGGIVTAWVEVPFDVQMVEAVRVRTHSTAEGQYGITKEIAFYETVLGSHKHGLPPAVIGSL